MLVLGEGSPRRTEEQQIRLILAIVCTLAIMNRMLDHGTNPYQIWPLHFILLCNFH